MSGRNFIKPDLEKIIDTGLLKALKATGQTCQAWLDAMRAV
jgi:hypothetical protein